MSAKDEAGEAIVRAGAGIGAAAGSAAVAAAGANVTAATAATASIAAAATGPFAGFAGGSVAPAAWAVALTNPLGASVAVGGLAAACAYGAYKLAQKAGVADQSHSCFDDDDD